MIRRFFRDDSGNFALMTAIAIVPIMGALALAVDYTEMSNQRQETLNALDAAGTATAHRIIEGVTDDEAKAYAQKFFQANLNSVDPAKATLSVVLPQSNAGGGTLKLCASLVYKPFFFPTFAKLIGRAGPTDQDFSACSEVRLKNTLEVALVLDNSGSMDDKGTGSGKKRIDLLKDASKQLVDTISGQAALMKQVNKPVQFALVPFSASVNIGKDKRDAAWMDQLGVSPIHHENFEWGNMPKGYEVTLDNGVYRKKGKSWPSLEQYTAVTRFTVFDAMMYYTNYNDTKKKASYTSWQGCIEARPYPYNVDDTAPTSSNPATLFVPMFAPDEASGGSNNYWVDDSNISGALNKQRDMKKYFDIPGGYVGAYGTSPAGMNKGPNLACTTSAITPLTDVSTSTGKTAIKNSIDAMTPTDNTNVPEGMAWGWRVLSHGLPFTEGRPETEKGNDKVVIVVTDGANTYSAVSDSSGAGNRSTYAALGYAGHPTPGYSTSRIFLGTSSSVSKTTYSATNYTKAMDEHFATLCNNAKAAGIMVMTVSLDLRTSVTSEKKAIDALMACASDSRFRRDANGKPVKLYWNTTGGNLSETFKDIASELSNLRIVS